MKKALVLPVLLALGFSICVIAQSEADYSGWMKDIAKTKGKVKKGIDSKANADVANDASHLADLFKQVSAFWSSRGASDAVGFAKSAETASNDLATAAKAGDDAKMQSSFATVGGQCGMCHMAHREGEQGSFKIK
jgi:cytochrome c556